MKKIIKGKNNQIKSNENMHAEIKKMSIIPANAYPYRRFRSYEVHVEELSEPAKALVSGIFTTDNRDDLSEVFAISPFTNLERAKLVGTDYHYRPNNPFKTWSEDDDTRDYDSHAPNCYTCNLWRFDAIKSHETPEAYFERQLDEMRRYGYTEFVTSFPKYAEARTGRGKKHPLYESAEEREKVVLDVKEKMKAIGNITAEMESKGATINGRLFFAAEALDVIFPTYFMRPVPEYVFTALKDLADEILPYYRKYTK